MFGKPVATGKQSAAPRAADPPTSAPAKRSPEREGLQLAIARRDKIANEVAVIAAELAAYSDKKFDARRAVEAAETGVAEAKARNVEYAIKTRFGTPAIPPVTQKEAREALVEAKDACELILESETTLGTVKAEMERQLSWANSHVRDSAHAVIRSDPAVRDLCARYETIKQEFLATRDVVDHLKNLRMLPLDTHFETYVDNRIELPAGSPWRAFFSALELSADAEAPS